MAQINLESGSTFTTAVLIADEVHTPNGSVDSIPQLTTVNGETASISFEIQSVLGAALLPRVTTTVMNSFTPVNGMIVFNITAQALYAYQNNAWAELASIGPDIGLTQGLNIVLTPNPITGSGTVATSTTLTSLISVQVGNITLSSSSINSAGSLIFETSGGTQALTLDTSQNAFFDGNVNLDNSNSLILGSNATGSTAFDPFINIYGSTSDYLNISMVSAGTQAQIQSVGVALNITGALGIFLQSAVTCSSTLALHSGAGGGSIVQQAPNIAGNFTYTWPTAYPVSSGYILSSTTAGVLSWILNEETTGTANTLAWFNGSGVLASNANVTVDTSGDITTTATMKAGNVSLSTSNLNSSGSLFLATNGSTTALTLNTSQNALFAGTVAIGTITLTGSTVESSGSLILATNGSTTALTLDTSQNATFVGNVILGGTKSVEAGSIILLSSGGGNIIQEAPVTASTFTYTWPSAYPVSNGYILSSTTAGVMSWIVNEETTGTANTLAWFNASGILASNTNVTVTSAGAITTASTMKAGNITLTGSTVESSGSLILATNGSTTALTLDTSQNATFAGLVQANGFTSVGNITINEAGSSGSSYTLYFNNGTNQSYLAYQGGSVFTAFSGGTLNLSAMTSTTLYTNNGTLALTLDTSQNATFAASINVPTNINMTGSGSLFTAQAIASAGGIRIDGSFGNFMFAGGTSGSNWAIYDSSSNLCFRVYNSGATATTSINNGTLESSGSLILATNGSTTALTLSTSQNATFTGTVKSGNITLSSSNINSSGSLVFGTNGSTTALTLNTSQNAAFVGNVNINSNSGLSLNNAANTFATTLAAGTSTANYTITFPPTAPSNAGFLNVPNSGTSNWITGRCSFQATVTIQTISANTATNVNFGASNYNLGGIITATSTNSQFQNTSGNTVIVLVTYNIYWVSANSYPCSAASYITLNGFSTAQYGTDFADFDISGKPLSTQGTIILTLNNNDYFNVVVIQNSSGNAFLNDAANLCYVNIWQLA
jgi:hypothetical protein